jgi:glycosyltransferase involved in cell wall biosynthesis
MPAAMRTPARARRVLFVVANDWYFWCHRLPLATRVAAAGYDVHVATPPGRFRAEIERAGLTYTPIRMDRQGRNPLVDARTIAELVRLYRGIRPDVVHHVALKPIVYGTLAARLAGVPAVVNAMPGMGYVFLNKQLLSRAIRPGIMAAFRLLVNAPNCRVILQNPDDVETWVRWRVMRRDRIALIRGAGVDTDHFVPTPEPTGTPLVVLPARLLFDKGVGEFVEAARLLRARGVAVRMALVGEGDPGNPASVPPATLTAWQAEGTIELFGWRDDMRAVLREANVVCLPSYGEGLPKALLEAAASGRAIVATNVPGCREVVKDGETGLLVPARDAAALADALARVVTDADLRARMAARGRALALAELSADVVAARTLDLYATLLDSSVTKKSRPMRSIENGAPVRDIRR